MSRFFVKGVIIEPPEVKTFSNNAKSVSITVEERMTYVCVYHTIEYNGKNAELIPTDISLLGAEVFATGTLIGKKNEESTRVFENLRGDTFSIIGFPLNEQTNE